jgi:hypothetical protein
MCHIIQVVLQQEVRSLTARNVFTASSLAGNGLQSAVAALRSCSHARSSRWVVTLFTNTQQELHQRRRAMLAAVPLVRHVCMFSDRTDKYSTGRCCFKYHRLHWDVLLQTCRRLRLVYCRRRAWGVRTWRERGSCRAYRVVVIVEYGVGVVVVGLGLAWKFVLVGRPSPSKNLAHRT